MTWVQQGWDVVQARRTYGEMGSPGGRGIVPVPFLCVLPVQVHG